MTEMSIENDTCAGRMNPTSKEAAPAGVRAPVVPGPDPTGGAMEKSTADAGAYLARLDGCPSCVTNAELPFGAYNRPSGGLVCLYKCTDCGHRWHTGWAVP